MDQEFTSVQVKQVSMEAVYAAAEKIKQDHGDKIVTIEVKRGSDRTILLEVDRDHLLAVGRYLHDDPALLFEYSSSMSGVDMVTHFKSLIFLHSLERGLSCRLKTKIDAQDPRCPSTELIWPTNNWHERECYDMFGIKYTGHSDLRRMYLSEDFAGFPLRKSFGAPGRNVGGHDGGVQILRYPITKEGQSRG